MRQLFLNDLSLQPLAQDFSDAWKRVERFIKTFKSRPTDMFESRICCEGFIGSIQLTKDLDLQSFCQNPKGRTLGSLLLGLTKHPYITSGSIQEDKFLESDYFLLKNDDELTAYGLTSAFLSDSAGIGFVSEPFWNNLSFTLSKKDGNQGESIQIFCASCPEHFQDPEFIAWQEERRPVEPIVSALLPGQKTIELRDDHGQDVLFRFAKKLVQSPYVLSIVNSLPFNPRSTAFIKTVKEDGTIELVLTWTDRGLGLVVKTTGRNLRETRKIAAILQAEFKN